MFDVRRREFITLIGGAAALPAPFTARAQQPAMPVIGYYYSGLEDGEQLSRRLSARG